MNDSNQTIRNSNSVEDFYIASRLFSLIVFLSTNCIKLQLVI